MKCLSLAGGAGWAVVGTRSCDVRIVVGANCHGPAPVCAKGTNGPKPTSVSLSARPPSGTAAPGATQTLGPVWTTWPGFRTRKRKGVCPTSISSLIVVVAGIVAVQRPGTGGERMAKSAVTVITRSSRTLYSQARRWRICRCRCQVRECHGSDRMGHQALAGLTRCVSAFVICFVQKPHSHGSDVMNKNVIRKT